jgi:CHAT domain-containing protein
MIGNVFEHQATILVQDDATLEAIKNLVPRYNIIHIAAHARFDDVRPMYSSLFLAGTPGSHQSGELRAFDILHLPLTADLVVLSACNSGSVNTNRGLSGLEYAFLNAGAKSVLSTLWNVEDESTAMLMEQFYRNIKAGERKSRALQLAMLYLISHGKSDPFYWAAFRLTGDNSPIILSSPATFSNSAWYVALILVVLTAEYFLHTRESNERILRHGRRKVDRS